MIIESSQDVHAHFLIIVIVSPEIPATPATLFHAVKYQSTK